MDNTSTRIHCPTCSKLVDPSVLIPVGNQTVCPECKSLYVQRMREGVPNSPVDARVWQDRELHIKHETSVRAIGLLYYLTAFFILFGIPFAVAILVPAISQGLGGGLSAEMIGVGIISLVYMLFGFVFFLMARAIRKLKRWVRIPATLFGALGLLSFPVGTLINIYILYTIWCEKGKRVFLPDYQDVIAATPEIKYQYPTAIKVLLGVILLFILLMIVSAFLT